LSDARELSVVMPVYNEVAAVGAVVASWAAVLERLGIDYELLVYDDGSTDGTGAALDALAAALARLRVTHHANRGHGPSIMRGYAEATGRWVFQTATTRFRPARSPISGPGGTTPTSSSACGRAGRPTRRGAR
jgi:cellulose synthase/poly-beta-1,6-N-acetylglucosamine synthase-like glycosyltransferase